MFSYEYDMAILGPYDQYVNFYWLSEKSFQLKSFILP